MLFQCCSDVYNQVTVDVLPCPFTGWHAEESAVESLEIVMWYNVGLPDMCRRCLLVRKASAIKSLLSQSSASQCMVTFIASWKIVAALGSGRN